MQVFAVGETLYREDLGILVRDGQREAAVDAPTVEQDGAGTALAVVATLLGTVYRETFAQCIQEGRAGIDGELARNAVHQEVDLKFHRCRASRSPETLTMRSQV